MRRVATIPCGDAWLMATIDGPPDAATGWVFVVGGTQTRVGPHRLYERLAARLAAGGEAVIRFDRRGVGDSPGADPGFAESGADIQAAAGALRAAVPSVRQLAGFGLCDGAAALALHGRAAGITRIVAANPWVIEPVDDLPPAAAIRGHYARRIADPAAWRRLLRGRVDLRRLARGLLRSGRREDGPLAARVAEGLPPGSIVVLAEGDGTAQAFDAAWRTLPPRPDVTIARIATASHSFAGEDAFAALAAELTRPR